MDTNAAYQLYLGRTPSVEEIKAWGTTVDPATFQKAAAYEQSITGYTPTSSTAPTGMMSSAAPAYEQSYDPSVSAQPVYTTVQDLYSQYLKRSPDAEGLKYWTQQFGNSVDTDEVRAFLDSVAKSGNAHDMAAIGVTNVATGGYQGPAVTGGGTASFGAGGLMTPATTTTTTQTTPNVQANSVTTPNTQTTQTATNNVPGHTLSAGKVGSFIGPNGNIIEYDANQRHYDTGRKASGTGAGQTDSSSSGGVTQAKLDELASKVTYKDMYGQNRTEDELKSAGYKFIGPGMFSQSFDPYGITPTWNKDPLGVANDPALIQDAIAKLDSGKIDALSADQARFLGTLNKYSNGAFLSSPDKIGFANGVAQQWNKDQKASPLDKIAQVAALATMVYGAGAATGAFGGTAGTATTAGAGTTAGTSLGTGISGTAGGITGISGTAAGLTGVSTPALTAAQSAFASAGGFAGGAAALNAAQSAFQAAGGSGLVSGLLQAGTGLLGNYLNQNAAEANQERNIAAQRQMLQENRDYQDRLRKEALGLFGQERGTATGSLYARTPAEQAKYVAQAGVTQQEALAKAQLESLAAGNQVGAANTYATGLMNAGQTYANTLGTAGKNAAKGMEFTPVGVTSRFATTTANKDANGNLNVGYNLSPEMLAQQNQLMGAAGQGLNQFSNSFGATAPMGTAAQQMFGLGQGYLAQNPQDQARLFYDQQQALLDPSRARQTAADDARLAAQGRLGLNMMGGNPEIRAREEARRMQDLQLAANATQGGQQYAQFGADMINRGGSTLRDMYSTQTAAFNPYQTAMGGVQTLENQGLDALTRSMQYGGQQTAANTNAANMLYNSAQGGAGAVQNAANTGLLSQFQAAQNPYANANYLAAQQQGINNIYGANVNLAGATALANQQGSAYDQNLNIMRQFQPSPNQTPILGAAPQYKTAGDPLGEALVNLGRQPEFGTGLLNWIGS